MAQTYVNDSRNVRRGSIGALLVLMLATIFSMTAATASAQDIQTSIQFLHAAADTTDVEVFINGDGVLDEFSYGDISDKMDVDPGTARITITLDRTGFNYVIFDSVYPVPAGNDYYVIITDALVIVGAFDTADLADGEALVSVVQGSVDLPAVNIAGTIDGDTVAGDLRYSQTSDPIVAPAGSVDFDVTLADSGESVLTQTGVELESGQSHLLVLIGVPDDTDHPLTFVTLSAGGSSSATPAS